MKPNKQTLKAQLLAQCEEALDKALARLDNQVPMDLDEIEEIALKARAKIGAEITQALAEHASVAPIHPPLCPECGQKSVYKGDKSKVVSTRSGDIRLERAHYYCPDCHKGFFPPR